MFIKSSISLHVDAFFVRLCFQIVCFNGCEFESHHGVQGPLKTIDLEHVFGSKSSSIFGVEEGQKRHNGFSSLFELEILYVHKKFDFLACR